MIAPVASQRPPGGAAQINRLPQPKVRIPKPFEGLAAMSGMLFLFMVASRTPDIIGIAGLVLVIAMTALVAATLAGSISEAVTSKLGILYLLFTIWLCVCLPFGAWPGGSFKLLKDVWSRSFLSFYIFGAAFITLQQLRRAMFACGFAALALLLYTLKFGSSETGRLGLTIGGLSNPNDLAALLLLMVPFCAFVLLETGQKSIKALMALVILMLLMLTLKTGSRSALVNICCLAVYVFFQLPFTKKAGMAVVSLVLVLLAPLYLPSSVTARFRTLLSSESAPVQTGGEDSKDRQDEFASSSTESRSYLLRQSVLVTLRNPLFGVGPGMFAVANSTELKESGEQAHWQQTHNTFTQVSSENGIPGLILFVAIIINIFRATALPKWMRLNPAYRTYTNISATLRLTLVAFCGGAMFGSLAYGMHLPLIAGLAEALRRVVKGQIEAAKQQASPVVATPNMKFAHALQARS